MAVNHSVENTPALANMDCAGDQAGAGGAKILESPDTAAVFARRRGWSPERFCVILLSARCAKGGASRAKAHALTREHRLAASSSEEPHVMHHVLFADDHAVTRRGLRELLQDAFAGVNVVEAVDGPSVVAQAAAQPWDIILLDIMMPGGSILDVIAQIRAANNSSPILIVTAAPEPEYVIQTLKAGANGFIHKHRAMDELLEAIKQVSQGKTYLHGDSADAIAASLRAPEKQAPHCSLSARELEIFCAIARGRSIKEIASNLNLSDKTVATYLARIRDKTGLQSHVDIARYALQHGLVD